MGAEIIELDAWRRAQDCDVDIDLDTAVDVAIRDLKEIRTTWGTDEALKRLLECEEMLRAAFAGS